MMLLREFIARLPSDPELFLRRHSLPAVLVAPHRAEESKSTSAPEIGFSTISLKPGEHDDTQRIDQSKATALLQQTSIDPDTDQIAWLEKSDRNVFAGMITAGRAENNDLILANPIVSKLHIIFRKQGDVWKVVDSNSTNGTSLNGKVLPAERYCVIKDWDVLVLSNQLSLQFFQPIALFEMCRTVR